MNSRNYHTCIGAILLFIITSFAVGISINDIELVGNDNGPAFTGFFTIVLAENCKDKNFSSGILGTYSNESVISLSSTECPLGLIVNVNDKTFTRVVFDYDNDGTIVSHVEFNPPYSFAGNFGTEFNGAEYLNTDGMKSILVRGYDRANVVDEVRFVFRLSPKSPSPNKTCFNTNSELRRAILSYIDEDDNMTVVKDTYGSNIGEWCVDNVEDFTGVFGQFSMAISPELPTNYSRGLVIFNEDISDWNTSSAKDMSWMFYEASSFNQDLSKWDVSRVVNMDGMFYEALLFNGNITTWDVSSVLSMNDMFGHAQSFNQDITHWNISSLRSMVNMFEGAISFIYNFTMWSS